MKACKHCEKEQPDNQFTASGGRTCRTCYREQKRLSYYRRVGHPAIPHQGSNYQRTLSLVADHGPLTRDALCEMTQFTRHQVNQLILRMRNSGVLYVSGERPYHVNRPDQRRYSLAGQDPDATLMPIPPKDLNRARTSVKRKPPPEPKFHDPEHQQWLATVRTRQREKQQRQRMEIRV